MNTPNLYTVKLKLNYHKINFQIDENILKLNGSSADIVQIILKVVLPGVLGLLLLIFGILYKINGLGLIGIILLSFSSYGITVIRKKRKNNKGNKLIKDGAIEIAAEDGNIILTNKTIKSFVVETELITQNEYVGKLIVRDDRNEYLILGINGNDEKVIQKDLDYIKKFIELKIG